MPARGGLAQEAIMKRWLVLGSVVAIGGFSMTLGAMQGQTQQLAPLPDLTKIKDNLYVIESSSPIDRSKFTGGNTAVFITEAGVVIVDTKLTGYGPMILDRIRKVTPKPVTTIINTHTHFDHTGSNEGFPATVDIVAHEGTKANMEKMDAFKGDKAKFLPKRTFKDRLSLFSGKDRIDLYHFGPGHTNGDTFILFTALRTLHAGDMFPWKDSPFIDRANGGSGLAWPNTLAKLLSTVKDFDAVIPGHIAVATRADLEEFQRYMTDLVAAVQAAKKAGQSADAATASVNLSAKYKGYATERLKAAVQAIYSELP
jgi:glyoxylase-like metal-dependent hydrolase (beta-lactamase superfamily II)